MIKQASAPFRLTNGMHVVTGMALATGIVGQPAVSAVPLNLKIKPG